MKKISFYSFVIVCLLNLFISQSYASREELSDGSYVDEQGNIYDSKFENTDISAPWNDPTADQRETNIYLRESGERNADYYWK